MLDPKNQSLPFFDPFTNGYGHGCTNSHSNNIQKERNYIVHLSQQKKKKHTHNSKSKNHGIVDKYVTICQ